MQKYFLFAAVILLTFTPVLAQETLYSRGSNGSDLVTNSDYWNTVRDGSGISMSAEGHNLVIQPSHTITINGDTTFNSIKVETNGLLIFDGLAARNITVKQNIEIESNAEFRTQYSNHFKNILTVGGDIINNGKFDMAVVSDRVCYVIFNSSGNQSISGSGSFRFDGIKVDLGNSTNILEIFSPFTMAVDSLNLTSGIFKVSSASTFMPFSGGDAIIPVTAGLIINHPDAFVQKGTSAGLEVRGILELKAGTMEVGSNTNSSLEIRGSNSYLKITGGILNVTGRLTQVLSSNIIIEDGELNLSVGGSIDVNAPVFNKPSTSKLTISGGTIKIYNANQNINQRDIEFSGTGNYFITGGRIVIGNGNQTNGNITINSGGILNNVEIDVGSNTAELKSNLQISGNLIFTSGNLDIKNSNLTLGINSAILGSPSASRMIITSGTGEVRKMYNEAGSFTFPVGDATGTAEYSPATINFISGTFNNAYVGVKVTNEKHSNVSSEESHLTRYWSLSSSGITDFNADLEFTYVDADIVDNESELYGAKWNGSEWATLDIVDAAQNKITGNVNSFSDFTAAAESGLPVELNSFYAEIFNNHIKLTWTTSTEIDNYGFDVERKKIVNNYENKWEKIAFIPGAGNSNSTKNYSYTDKNLLPGNYQYRLKQIDNDGQSEYSNIIESIVNPPAEFSLSQNYPNPFNPTTQIRFELPLTSMVDLKIYDILGREIKTLVKGELNPGTYSYEWDGRNDFGNPVSSGMYRYRITAGNFSETKK
jgi:hypothetical protein